MEFGAIKDTQIRASSEWDLNHAAIQGRLNFQKSGIKQGAWSSRNNDNNQWLQIDLRQSYTKVTAVASQGRNQASQWVTKYKLQYSNDGVTFQYYKEQGRTVDKVRCDDEQSVITRFSGNSGKDRRKKNYNEKKSVSALYVKFKTSCSNEVNSASAFTMPYGCFRCPFKVCYLIAFPLFFKPPNKTSISIDWISCEHHNRAADSPAFVVLWIRNCLPSQEITVGLRLTNCRIFSML